MGHIATYNESINWVQAQYFLLLSADDYLYPAPRPVPRADGGSPAGPECAMAKALEIHPDASTRQAQYGMKADGEAGSAP